MSHQGLLRFSTAGSVDDGKSTLIGRLLFDAKSIFEDQFNTLVRTTASRGGVGGNVAADLAVDLALLTDGLMAEREQGITIDVAYRYFATPERKFIIADTPGHEQYTRNMVTGASTADLTIILVDASKGVRPQSRRHALVAGLLGIRNVVVAVNKMDLVDWSSARFLQIQSEFTTLTAKLNLQNLSFIPVSALLGDMVVERGSHLDWYLGPTLLELLHLAPSGPSEKAEFRFPVQLVSRPGLANSYGRGYMGRIESGSVAVGDALVVLPGGQTTRVRDIVTYDGSLREAHAPASVTLLLEDDLDISRGALLSKVESPAHSVRQFEAILCWMDAQRLEVGRKYIVKQATQTTKALITHVDHRLDIENFEPLLATDLGMNEIGQVTLKVRDALAVDAYVTNRATGGFILIDENSNHTVAAGMILATTPGVLRDG